MIEKLKSIKKKFTEIEDKLSKSEVMDDMKMYKSLRKEYKDLKKFIEIYDEYTDLLNRINGTKEILYSDKDPDFRCLAKEELESLEQKKLEMDENIKFMLIPQDPNDNKNIILEIRAGTGGDEAGIFAGDLFRMYKRFFEKMGWKFSLISFTESTSGGYKEILCAVSGELAYSIMKYESGVHRVQRVPNTESQGRIHTSAASIAVLPEADDVEIQINMNDIRKETFCSSGAGGQSVNTTYSAVRLTHIPTGIVVSCQDERSQIKNYEKALKVLRSKLYDLELASQQESIGAERKLMIKNNDRSDKIRTYNYPQGRVTDHRIGLTMHNLSAFMDGDIYGLIEALKIADRMAKLQESK